ncbi:MAG: hypothetical protein E3K32_05765 [wastewater metagenome]|nr:hypothetical protein [Candidatus Loosdrechtia aerotolerans]
MLSVTTGLYHPFLEDSFIHTIRALKKESPLMPLAVVVPTNMMMHHLQKRLVSEERASFMNVSFMNSYILAREVCRYAGIDTGRVIPQPILYEYLIEGLLNDPLFRKSLGKNVRSLRALSRALFRVLYELSNANVCPTDLERAIQEKFFEGIDLQKLSGVTQLYRMFRQKLTDLKIVNFSDMYRIAAPSVSESQFLKNFQTILIYGFYDLTGVELDFFREIFTFHSTKLFIPYQKSHAAFSYVKPFFEAFILGLAQDIKEIPMDRGSAFPCAMNLHGDSSGTEVSGYKSGYKNCCIINTSGKRDGVWTVAKEILKLVDEGYKLEEIGVVARGLVPYTEDIKRIFQENCIPFITDLQEPLERYPLVKVIRQILLLKRENFYRPLVIELLKSPYFKISVPCSQTFTPRPDLWDVLSRRLGIRGGIECWLSRLKQASGMEAPEPADEDEAEKQIHISIDQIRYLEHILQALSNDLSSIPEKASWGVLSQKVAHFLQDYIGIPTEGMNQEDTGRDRAIMQRIYELLDIVCALDCLNEEVTREQFIDAFLDACRQEGLSPGLENTGGVTVLDVMSARGIPFRALFILGLNEKVFPRAISEEPFLRDHVRRRLNEVLGNYLPERLRGFEEEHMLFHLMINSARERLYLLYERSDETGKPKIPSHYLADILQNRNDPSAATENAKEKPEHLIYVPRGIKEKLCRQRISFLTPKETGIRLALERVSPTHFLKAFHINPDIFARLQLALNHIESYHPHLTAYDGILDNISRWWNEQIRYGFTPTALEVFGSCPFRFFLEKVLHLESLYEPEKGTVTTAVDLGNLYHSIVRLFYTTLLKKKYFDTKANELDPAEFLHDIAKRCFNSVEQRIPVPYPVIWELEKEAVLAFLANFIAWDLRRIEQTGYIPAYLERTVKINSGDTLPKNIKNVTLRGKIDRIDLKWEDKILRFRVVDYKSGRFFKENIMRSAIRGQRLQLPFYIILAEYIVSKEGEKGRTLRSQIELEEASFTYIAQVVEGREGQKGVPEKVIKREDWKEHSEQCWGTVREFLHYIRNGIFPVTPLENTQKCEWCEFTAICRRGNQPLRFRLEHDVRLKKYHEIMNQTASKNP